MLLWGGRLVWNSQGDALPADSERQSQRSLAGSEPDPAVEDTRTPVSVLGRSGPRQLHSLIPSPSASPQYAAAVRTGAKVTGRSAAGEHPPIPKGAVFRMSAETRAKLTPAQVDYEEKVLQPLLTPMLVEAMTALADRPECFFLQWLCDYLKVPHSVSDPLLSWVKVPRHPSQRASASQERNRGRSKNSRPGSPSADADANFGFGPVTVSTPASASSPPPILAVTRRSPTPGIESEPLQSALRVTKKPSVGKRVSLQAPAPADASDTRAGGGEPCSPRRRRSVKVPLPTVPHHEIVEMMRRVPLFQVLSSEEVERLAHKVEVQSFEADEDIVRCGEQSKALHMIWSGEGRVSVPTHVGTLRRGDVFGQYALVKRHLASTTTVTAQVEEETRLVTLALSDSGVRECGLLQKLEGKRRGTGGLVGALRPRKIGKRHTLPMPETRSDNLGAVYATKPEDQELIMSAVRENSYFDFLDLSEEQVKKMATHMRVSIIASGECVTHRGEHATTFYIVHDGLLEVLTGDAQTDMEHGIRLRTGDSFGEQALLYNCPRKATVRAVRQSQLWSLDRQEFRDIMKLKTEVRIEQYQSLISSVPTFVDNLNQEEQESLADALEETFFMQGEEIVRQGDVGDTFFVIFQGECNVDIDGETKHVLTKGSYFGELALMSGDRRAASVVVASETATLLMLDSASFQHIIGNKLNGVVCSTGLKQQPNIGAAPHRVESEPRIPWDGLENLGYLGFGACAQVTLRRYRDTGQLYALKALSKRQIKRDNMPEYVLREKRIMEMLDSKFVGRLHCTYRDDAFVYFLLDVAPGGELYDLYTDHEGFFGSVAHARFYAICCAIGLEHMHARRIVHRDVKLENVLMYGDGYACLTDFGLAKVVIGKTYTICGTADYFAPETLRQAGHNRAVDWWALGIMVFIMMAGRSPFDADNVMEIYRNIVKGFKKASFPNTFENTLSDLIQGLCRKSPEERLPMGPGGLKHLQQHPWLQAVPFDAVKERTFKAPYQPPPLDLQRVACRQPPPEHTSENGSDEEAGHDDEVEVEAWDATF